MEPEKGSSQLACFQHAAYGADQVLRVSGELDVYTAPHFAAALKRISNATRIIVDLRECRYLDASAMTVLVRARKAAAAPIRLVIHDGSMLRRVLGITSVDRLFGIFSTVDAASRDITRSVSPRERPDRANRAPR